MTVCYVSLLNLAEEVADEYPERPFIVGPGERLANSCSVNAVDSFGQRSDAAASRPRPVAVVSDEPQIVHAAVVSLSGLASRLCSYRRILLMNCSRVRSR